MDKLREQLISRLPLLMVFISGFGLSLQALTVGILADTGIKAAFHCILSRGFFQFISSGILIYYSEERKSSTTTLFSHVFGSTNYVRLVLLLRCMVGITGITTFFQACEYMPIGDATVITTMSPIITSIAAFFVLGEPWRLVEMFATLLSIIGATLVVKPSFLFGSSSNSDNQDFLVGTIFAFLSAFFAGISFFTIRMLGTSAKLPWMNVAFVYAIAQLIFPLFLSPLPFIGENLFMRLTTKQFLTVIAAGMIGAPSAILMTVGMQREKGATAAAARMSDIFFNFVWQQLFTSSPVSGISVFGAVLVCTGVLLVIVFKPKASDNSKDSIQSTQVGDKDGSEYDQETDRECDDELDNDVKIDVADESNSAEYGDDSESSAKVTMATLSMQRSTHGVGVTVVPASSSSSNKSNREGIKRLLNKFKKKAMDEANQHQQRLKERIYTSITSTAEYSPIHNDSNSSNIDNNSI